MLTAPRMPIYLPFGSSVIRKSINVLSILVEDDMEMVPFPGSMFVFYKRRRTIYTVLY